MTTKPLLDFIKSQTILGVSKEAITKMLTGEGWTVSDVEEAYLAIPASPMTPMKPMASEAAKPAVAAPKLVVAPPDFNAMFADAPTVQVPNSQPPVNMPVTATVANTPSPVSHPPISPMPERMPVAKFDPTALKTYNRPIEKKRSSTKFVEVVLIILILVCVAVAGLYVYNMYYPKVAPVSPQIVF